MERQGEHPVRTDDIAAGGGGDAPPGGEAPADRSRTHPPPDPEPGTPAQAAPSGETAVAGPPPTGGSTWQPQSASSAQGAPAPPAHGGVERTEGAAPPAHADRQGAPAPATPSAATSAGTSREPDSTPLLPDAEASEFERRWAEVQVGFVDEPQRCVQEADSLVAEVMQRLADSFARERQDLEAQWASGGEASTEDLRVALQRYRSFFNRLLRTS